VTLPPSHRGPLQSTEYQGVGDADAEDGAEPTDTEMHRYATSAKTTDLCIDKVLRVSEHGAPCGLRAEST